MHVNTCLDSSWAKPEPCEPLPVDSPTDLEEIKPVTAPAKGKSAKQQPISAFCVSTKTSESAAKSEDEDDATPQKGPNAFSVLMSGHKEDKQWKVAEDDLRRDGKRVFGRRKAPFYKVLTGMPIAVDAFRYGNIPGVKAYFLTHAHSDHYTNLSGSWKHGPIYCSETTANLIKLTLGVNPEYVHGLPWDVPYEIPGTGGVKVTVIKANHCPGSSIFLYEGRQTANAGDSEIKSPYVGSKREWRYLHCGDFRACPAHVLHPAIAGKKIDTVYLDTTYLNPQYCFPPQPLVIAACADLARRTVLGYKAAELGAAVKTEAGDEEDVKPYLAGQEGANFDEKGRELMANWLVNEDEKVKTDGDDDVKPTKGRRTLVIMGYVSSVSEATVNADLQKRRTYSIGKERIVKGGFRDQEYSLASADSLSSGGQGSRHQNLLRRTQTLHSALSSRPRASCLVDGRSSRGARNGCDNGFPPLTTTCCRRLASTSYHFRRSSETALSRICSR